MLKIKLSLITSLILLIVSTVQATFESPYFTYGDTEYKNIQVRLSDVTTQGYEWVAENTTEDHIPFFSECYSNPQIMSMFATGIVREKEEALKYAGERIGIWAQRFKNGQPHGGLVIKDIDGKFIGHIVAGGGDGPGVSEVARFLMTETQGKGIGTSVLKAIVQNWAPEVSRIGHDTSLGLVHERFKCFGGQALERLDVTSSPSNVASWVSQDKAGFVAAESNILDSQNPIVNYDGKEYQEVEKKEQYAAMEKELLKLFDINTADTVLKPGVRYKMIDLQGIERTFSKHLNYDRIKYHAEYQLPK